MTGRAALRTEGGHSQDGIKHQSGSEELQDGDMNQPSQEHRGLIGVCWGPSGASCLVDGQHFEWLQDEGLPKYHSEESYHGCAPAIYQIQIRIQSMNKIRSYSSCTSDLLMSVWWQEVIRHSTSVFHPLYHTNVHPLVVDATISSSGDLEKPKKCSYLNLHCDFSVFSNCEFVNFWCEMMFLLAILPKSRQITHW